MSSYPLSPYHATNYGFIHNDTIRRVQGQFVDSLCNCGYLLPSWSAIEVNKHSQRCAYRLAIEQIQNPEM